MNAHYSLPSSRFRDQSGFWLYFTPLAIYCAGIKDKALRCGLGEQSNKFPKKSLNEAPEVSPIDTQHFNTSRNNQAAWENTTSTSRAQRRDLIPELSSRSELRKMWSCVPCILLTRYTMSLNTSSLKSTFRMNQKKPQNTPNSSCRKHSPNLADDLQPRLNSTCIFSWAQNCPLKVQGSPQVPSMMHKLQSLSRPPKSRREDTKPKGDQTRGTLSSPYHLPSCQLRSPNRWEVGEPKPCHFISMVSSDNSQKNRPGWIKFICTTIWVACCSRDLFLGLPQMLQIVFGFFFGQSRKGDESMLSHLLSQRDRSLC